MAAAHASLRWLFVPVLLVLVVASQGCGGGGSSFVSTPPPPVAVTVSSTSSTVLTDQVLQLTASVTGSTNHSVTWTIDSASAGTALGTISTSGRYTAPSIPPTPNTVTVRATSNADSTKSATAVLTIDNPVPAITAVSPSVVDAGSADTAIAVTGSGFNPLSVIQLNGTSLTTNFAGTSQVTATVPAAQLASAGNLWITVTNPVPGGGASSAAALKVAVVVSVLPASATTITSQTQQFTASVLGSTDQSVTWSIDGAGSGNATVGTISTSGLFTAPAVPPVPNTVTIRATSVADATRSASATAGINNPLPVLTSISPTTLNAGGSSATVTISGSNFTPQSSAQLNGVSLATTFVSSTQLTAALSNTELSTAGTFPISVVTPAPGGGASSSSNLTISIVVSVSPASATALVGQTQQFADTVSGSTNQDVTWSIDGAGSGNATVGTISSAGLYTPPSVPPVANTITIRATSIADSSKSSAAAVTINNPAPALTSIAPSQIDAGSSATTITLNGSQFTTQSVAQLSGTALPTTYVSTTQLTAMLTSAQLANAATYPMTVATPTPGGGTSSNANLSVLLVVGISPGSATSLTEAMQQFTATITGSANQSVTWSIDGAGSGNATVGTISTSGLYTAPAVPPVPNTVTIRATSVADATRSAAVTATINNPLPVLTSISPTQLDAGSGTTTFTVNGSAFNPQSVIKLNGTSLTTSYSSSTQLTASLSAAQLGTAGVFPVSVVAPAPGGGASSSSNLTISVVVSVSPASPPVLSDATQQFSATVTGSTNQNVTWSIDGNGSGNSTVGTIDTTGLYTAPAAPPSPNSITIRATSAADNTRSGAATATISNPAPVVTAISPSQVNAGSADTTITVDGSGFSTQAVVQLNGATLTTTFVNSTQLTAVIPAADLSTAGDLPVTVVTPSPGGGASGSLTFSVIFTISVSPASTSTITTQTQSFTATVSGSADQTVTWSIDGAGAGNSTVGTIDSTGLYTAPSVVPSSPAITIRATSNADPTKSATAALTIASILEDWPKYRRDLSNTGRSAETLIYSGNVRNLQKKWSFTTDTFAGTARISASPAVATVGGIRTVYIGAWSGFFYGINADDGSLRWRYEVPRNADPAATHCTTSSRCRIASSATVDNGIVYFGAEDAYLYALDAATGALIWRQQLGDTEAGAEVWSSPAVANGVVYVGMASHNSAPCVVGKVAAFNAADGTPVWSFDTIDQTSCSSGTCLGAGIWSSPAIDQQFGTLWVGTGNAGAGCVPATSQATRYPDGILALNSSTGALKGFYQTMPNDTTDGGDVGATPSLHSTQVVDQCTPANDVQQYWVSVPSKDNKFWTAPRDSGGFLANPVYSSLDGSMGITSPAAQSFVEVQSCAAGKTITTTNNHLYVPTSGGNMFSFLQNASPSPETPAFDWQTQIDACGGNACPLFSAPASVDDLIFFGGGDGNFYAMLQDGTFLDGTGTRIFSFGTGGLVASGPAISHGQVIFGSYDGNVYCLSLNGQ